MCMKCYSGLRSLGIINSRGKSMKTATNGCSMEVAFMWHDVAICTYALGY